MAKFSTINGLRKKHVKILSGKSIAYATQIQLSDLMTVNFKKGSSRILTRYYILYEDVNAYKY